MNFALLSPNFYICKIGMIIELNLRAKVSDIGERENKTQEMVNRMREGTESRITESGTGIKHRDREGSSILIPLKSGPGNSLLSIS